VAVPGVVKSKLLTLRNWLRTPPRWAWVWEAALGLLLVASLNHAVWPRDPGFRASPINPYLVVVLLIGIRYGSYAGFLSGLAAAGVFLVSATLLRDLPLNADLVGTDRSSVAAVLVLSGILVGGFVQSLHEGALFHRDRADAAVRELNHIRQQVLISPTAPAERERERTESAESSPIVDVLERIRNMKVMPDSQIYQTVLDVLQFHFGAESSAIYLLKDLELSLCASRDRHSAYRFPERLSAEEGVTGLALRTGKVVTTVDLKDGIGGPFVISGPLLGRHGPARGLVAIRQIPFLKVGPALLSRLANLLEWTSECLSDPRRVGGGRPAVPAEVRREPLGRSYLRFFLEAALLQAQENNLKIGLLLFRIGDYAAMVPGRRLETWRATTRVLMTCIRTYDCLCMTDQADLLAMVLVAPKVDCSAAVLERVRRAWQFSGGTREQLPEHLLSSAFFVPPAPESLESLLAQAEQGLSPVDLSPVE
jgi:hypothetical protein